MMNKNQKIGKRNAANYAGRLLSVPVLETKNERCHQCGELLHPYPEPEYWMQYPLPECHLVDGLKVCYSYRKPDCLDEYLAGHPVRATGRKVRKPHKKPMLATDGYETAIGLEKDLLPARMSALPVAARLANAVESDRQGLAPLPTGFVQVDVVLTEQQAFMVRKWAETARSKIQTIGEWEARIF
jgi:hypothetical protein